MSAYSSRRSFILAVSASLMAAPVLLALGGCGSSEPSSPAPANAASDAGEQAAGTAVDSGDYVLVEKGKLTIGSDLAYPPMEYLNGDMPAGFGVGMMQEVCKRLGLERNFLGAQNFDTLIAQVAAGTKMDVAVSSITISDERQELVDFSDPYYDSNLAVVVMGDSGYTAKEELDGLPVGAQSGSTGEDWVRENLTGSELVPYNTPAEALAAMRTGRVEAVVYDEPVARGNVAGEYYDCKVLEVIATGEQYGIAINKDDDALREAINAALSSMEDDGTMDQLKRIWIDGGSDGETGGASGAGDAGPADSDGAAGSSAD